MDWDVVEKNIDSSSKSNLLRRRRRIEDDDGVVEKLHRIFDLISKALSSSLTIILAKTIIYHSKRKEEKAIAAHGILISLSKKISQILEQDVHRKW